MKEPFTFTAVATVFLSSATLAEQPGWDANPAGAPMRQITFVVNAYAAFSPDGRTIAYQSNANGNWDLFAMDTDGKNIRRLTDNPAADITPVFSPDGKTIAFCSERDGNRNVYLMDADGQNQRRITDDPGNDLHPYFSADGKRLIFSSNRQNADADDFDIYTMNADGTNPARLTSGPDVDTYASWSPEGARIVTRRVIDGNNEIFVMNADGSEAKNLTNDASAYDGWPVWSPNGRRIAFASGHPGASDHHIYLINPDGTGRTRLTTPPPGTKMAYYTQPVFSPDGTKLACTMYRPESAQESSEIVLLNVPAEG